MKQQALQARAEGRLDDAARLWRQVLRAAPDDWQSALELRTDLAAAGHYSESDAQFRRAARALPDDAWLAHYGGLYTFHPRDLPWLVRRARQLLQRQPDAAVHRLLGDLLMQQRRWGAAAAHLAKAPPGPGTAAQAALAGLYRRLARLPDIEGPRYEIALINLDSNPARHRTILDVFRRSKAPLFRVPAVAGRLLPEPAVQRLAGEDSVTMRGTLGCFLSHASAWETMLARGLPYCMIIEDDVTPMLPLPATLGPFGLPASFDLCFVNDRLQPRWRAAQVAAAQGWQPVKLADAFASFPPEDNAPGGDGYVLSAAGARKLLAWVAEDGFHHDVDWRLLTYGLGEAEYATVARHSHAWGVLDSLRHLVRRTDRLDAYVLHPAALRTVALSSDREDANRHRRA